MAEKERLLILVLAAGEGTRMKSDLPKVLHPLCGRPMIEWVLEAAASAGRRALRLAVLGRGHEQVAELVASKGWGWVHQAERLGTGHALMAAAAHFHRPSADVLVLNGDTPLVRPATLAALLARHRAGGAPMTFLTARPAAPAGYGRVRRGRDGRVEAIVEQKELRRAGSAGEINAGVYVFRTGFLLEELPHLERHPGGEYYLTDLAAAAAGAGTPAETLELSDPEEALGVNSRSQLAAAGERLRRRILASLMDSGVTVTDPACTYVDAGVKVGRDTVLLPGVVLETGTRVGRACRLGPWARISASSLGDRVEVRDHSVVEGSVVRREAAIGPMARLRPGTVVGAGARVGNFVEVKQSILGEGVKASHLTYLGDARVGAGANIGAGTVTCNYDGRAKHRTVIGAGAFIGSDSMLVAPLKVGRGAVVGAGSTVTRDVPADALAVERAPLVVTRGWARRRRAAWGKEK